MSRFNKNSVGTKIVNRAGGEAYSESPKLELVSLLLTSFVNDKFYESAKGQLDRLAKLVSDIKEKKFLGQAAVYARTKFGMRSITHALLGEIVKNVKGESWVKNAIDKAIFRVDDITETMSYYGNKYGKPIPNSLKKGIALALNKFDGYQLAKYKGSGKDVKLVDVLNMVHPKPSDKQKDMFKSLIEGKLASTETWESKLSEAGKVESEDEEEKAAVVAMNKAEVWTSLLNADKLGYFALLRNIRNISEQAPELLPKVAEKLVDEKAIAKSLIFPFQFMTAYNAVRNASVKERAIILPALDKAVDLSVKNTPEFSGKTLVVLDESGSMRGRPREIGSLFLATLAKRNPTADTMMFSDDAYYIAINPASLITDIVSQIPYRANGTNFNSIFERADKAYDRIIILSDMQGWMAPRDGYYNIGGAPTKAFNAYKKKFNCEPKIYSFDLNGYGELMFPENNIYCISGFSDKTLELLKLLEQDRNALVKEIEAIDL